MGYSRGKVVPSHNARGREPKRASALGWRAAFISGLALIAAAGAARAETPELADKAFELSARVRDLGSEYRSLYLGAAVEAGDDGPTAAEPAHKPPERNRLGTHRETSPPNQPLDDGPDDR